MISIVPKGELEIWVNEHRTIFFDYFFYYTTTLGNGWVYVVFILCIFLMAKRKYFFMSAVTGIACILVSTTMKLLIFTNEPRPAEFFKDTLQLHFVQGAPVLYSGSFPSGHTLSAFSLFCLASFFVKRKALQIPFFLLALAVGCSRIYLLAHFKEDVYAGAIIGSSISLLVIFVFEKYFSAKKKMEIRLIRIKGLNEKG